MEPDASTHLNPMHRNPMHRVPLNGGRSGLKVLGDAAARAQSRHIGNPMHRDQTTPPQEPLYESTQAAGTPAGLNDPASLCRSNGPTPLTNGRPRETTIGTMTKKEEATHTHTHTGDRKHTSAPRSAFSLTLRTYQESRGPRSDKAHISYLKGAYLLLGLS
jgi:hypothetical protein